MTVPDLTKDRMTVTLGATLPGLDHGHLVRAAHKMTVVHRQVPIGHRPGLYPREPCFRTHADVVCGTVDEIVDDLRQGLVRCVELLTGPEWGQDRWAAYQRFLAERGVTGLVKGPDSRICASPDDPRTAAFRAEREAVHDNPALTLDEQDLVEDLIFSFDWRYSPRDLARMLLAYADHKEHGAPVPVVVDATGEDRR